MFRADVVVNEGDVAMVTAAYQLYLLCYIYLIFNTSDFQ